MFAVSHARALALVVLVATLLIPAPARAEDETITFDGGGWGHGVGFSQWGAQGMALADPSLSGAEIATYYYEGTTTAQADAQLPASSFMLTEEEPLWIGLLQNRTTFTFRVESGTVEICQHGDGVTDCQRPQPQAGESWTFSSLTGGCRFANTGVPEVLGDCIASIQLAPGAVVRVVDAGGGAHWGPDLLLTSGTIKIRPPGNAPTIGSPEFLNWLDGPTFHVVARMDLEPYLEGISEALDGWQPAALQAQALAARSYAINKAEARESGTRAGNYLQDPSLGSRAASCWCHMYRDTRDMNFVGQVGETPGWVAAVGATAGTVIVSNAGITQFGIIEAYFYSSTFGATEWNTTGFGSGVSYPYLTSVPDPWSNQPGNSNWRWTEVVLEQDVIDALQGPFAVGRSWYVEYIDITDATVQAPPGGTVTFDGIRANGTTETVVVPGWWLRSRLGLKSPAVLDAEMTGNQGRQTMRLAGPDRYRTAVAVSQSAFPTGADTVLIATGENFPDSLAGAAAGYRLDAPILLTNTNVLNTYTKQELNRLDPSTIIILGGPAAVSPSVEAELAAYAPAVERLWGATRYETAAAITEYAFGGDVSTIFVVGGADFPEAVVAGPAAAAFDGPVLLTRTSSLPTAVRNEILRLTPDVIVLVAPTAGVDASVETQLAAIAPVTRIAGADRYVTSALVSAYAFGTDLTAAYVATGSDYPDALTGGLAAARDGGPVLLVRTGSIPSAVASELTRLRPFDVFILGGTAVVSSEVENQLAEYLVP